VLVRLIAQAVPTLFAGASYDCSYDISSAGDHYLNNDMTISYGSESADSNSTVSPCS